MVVYQRGRRKWPEQVDITHLRFLNPGHNTVNLQLSNHPIPYMPHLLRYLTVPIEAPGQTENRREIAGGGGRR